jgi:hypothetical protein
VQIYSACYCNRVAILLDNTYFTIRGRGQSFYVHASAADEFEEGKNRENICNLEPKLILIFPFYISSNIWTRNVKIILRGCTPMVPSKKFFSKEKE